MQITISDFGPETKKVSLAGKLDIAGAQTIELPMATVSGARCNVVIDMVGVDFIASIGIRHLVIAAKTVARNSRRLILLRPNALVTDVLVTAGLQDLLPIARSDDEAKTLLTSAENS
jgi:anti-sigma B factor antagonist